MTLNLCFVISFYVSKSFWHLHILWHLCILLSVCSLYSGAFTYRRYIKYESCSETEIILKIWNFFSSVFFEGNLCSFRRVLILHVVHFYWRGGRTYCNDEIGEADAHHYNNRRNIFLKSPISIFPSWIGILSSIVSSPV